VFAFLYVKANSKEICEEISSPSIRRKMPMLAFLMRFKANYLGKNAWLPLFFFVDSNSSYKDLLFPRGPNLAQKPLYLVGTVLNYIQKNEKKKKNALISVFRLDFRQSLESGLLARAPVLNSGACNQINLEIRPDWSPLIV